MLDTIERIANLLEELPNEVCSPDTGCGFFIGHDELEIIKSEVSNLKQLIENDSNSY